MLTRKERERAYTVQMAALAEEHRVCRLSARELLRRQREIHAACFGQDKERDA